MKTKQWFVFRGENGEVRIGYTKTKCMVGQTFSGNSQIAQEMAFDAPCTVLAVCSGEIRRALEAVDGFDQLNETFSVVSEVERLVELALAGMAFIRDQKPPKRTNKPH